MVNMSKGLQGIIVTKTGTYLFRDDHGHDPCIWAWNIHDDPTRGKTHKWDKLPNGDVVLFDIDNPPETVSYIPL